MRGLRRDELGRDTRASDHDENEYHPSDSERYTRRIAHNTLRVASLQRKCHDVRDER